VNPKLPNDQQVFSTDPRLFKSSEGFRDQVRRQFLCSNLHTDVHRCRLGYGSDDSEMNLPCAGGLYDVAFEMHDGL
jgi:hypothetical protein